MKTFTLQPKHEKSFYNKMKVEQNKNVSQLFSYTTHVASYNKKDNKLTINGYYSATTARHLNAFLEFHGLNSMTKKEIENYKN